MKRIIFGIILILLILGILVGYEWYGAFKKSQLIEQGIFQKEPFPINPGTPWYLIPFYTLLSYLQKAWFCLGMAFLIAGAVQTFIPKELIIKYFGKEIPRHILLPLLEGPCFQFVPARLFPYLPQLKKEALGWGRPLPFF